MKITEKRIGISLSLALMCSLLFPAHAISRTISIVLEHASTAAETSQGLMGRTSLAENHGMTFNFNKSDIRSFWMYNTLIDLSIAYLDENKVIKEIYELKAYPEIKDKAFFSKNTVKSTVPAKYALEMNRGWFERNGVHPGDQAFWSLDSPNGYIIASDPK